MLGIPLLQHYYITYGSAPLSKMDRLATLLHCRSLFISALTRFNQCLQTGIDADNPIDFFIDIVCTNAVSGVFNAYEMRLRRKSVEMETASAMVFNDTVIFPWLANEDSAALDVTTARTGASRRVENVGDTRPTSLCCNIVAPCFSSLILLLRALLDVVGDATVKHVSYPFYTKSRDCFCQDLT